MSGRKATANTGILTDDFIDDDINEIISQYFELQSKIAISNLT